MLDPENSKHPTIIVLGATGTLGTYLVDELAESGQRVIACGYRNVQAEYYARKGVGAAVIDITQKEHFERLPSSGVSAVVQISGAMPSRMEGYKPETYIDVNVRGTLNVLEYCRKAGVERHLFTQSHSDVANYWNSGKYIEAEVPRSNVYRGDHSVYCISKNTAVELMEHYHQEYGLRTIILRLPTIYNWRPILDMYVDGVKRPTAYLYLIEKALKGEQLEIWGDPGRAKDIVYVKDFNQMVIKAIASPAAQGVYNVATGVPTTLEQQVRGIAEIFSPKDRPSPIVYRPDRPSQASYLYDISKARRDLAYEPRYSYLDMLRDMHREMTGDRFKHLEKAVVTF